MSHDGKIVMIFVMIESFGIEMASSRCLYILLASPTDVSHRFLSTWPEDVSSSGKVQVFSLQRRCGSDI